MTAGRPAAFHVQRIQRSRCILSALNAWRTFTHEVPGSQGDQLTPATGATRAASSHRRAAVMTTGATRATGPARHTKRPGRPGRPGPREDQAYRTTRSQNTHLGPASRLTPTTRTPDDRDGPLGPRQPGSHRRPGRPLDRASRLTGRPRRPGRPGPRATRAASGTVHPTSQLTERPGRPGPRNGQGHQLTGQARGDQLTGRARVTRLTGRPARATEQSFEPRQVPGPRGGLVEHGPSPAG